MFPEPTGPVWPLHRLAELLLGYLESVIVSWWPGADGLTVEEVLLGYPRAADAGLVPGLEELLRRHPDSTGDLLAFFEPRGRTHEEAKL
jgi:hypothetical protein